MNLAPEQEALVDQVAWAIDPMPFQHRNALYEYCLICGDSEDDAIKTAGDTHTADCDRVLAIARAIIPLIYAAGRRAGREEAAEVAETDGVRFACTKRRTRSIGLPRDAYPTEVAREIAAAIRDLSDQENGRE